MFFHRYIAYLRDNPDNLWFKRKLYGWGWVPVRWQGWAVVLIFVGLLLLNALTLTPYEEPSTGHLVRFFAGIVVSSVAMIWICYKTGEKPRWQWGLPKPEDRNG